MILGGGGGLGGIFFFFFNLESGSASLFIISACYLFLFIKINKIIIK